jgi:serine O-acetyltransferase
MQIFIIQIEEIMKPEAIKNIAQTLTDISSEQIFEGCSHCGNSHYSDRALTEIVDICRAVIFPGYYRETELSDRSRESFLHRKLIRLNNLLVREIGDEETVSAFISGLPQLRHLLATDVEATFNGDPAAVSYDEVISCYPGIRAICNYRIAHELYKLGVPLIPRMISEMAHRETGIDIHPEASIGQSFTIDHGTGVVIGATSVIGTNVKIYQGVTLGAKSFPLDAEGKPIKGIPRHPIIGNNVVIYSNATVLGRIVVGDGAIIGANIWITADVPAGARIVNKA